MNAALAAVISKLDVIFTLKGAVCDIVSPLDVVVLRCTYNQNKPAPCISSAASRVASTEPPLNKQGYNWSNATITVLWKNGRCCLTHSDNCTRDILFCITCWKVLECCADKTKVYCHQRRRQFFGFFFTISLYFQTCFSCWWVGK